MSVVLFGPLLAGAESVEIPRRWYSSPAAARGAAYKFARRHGIRVRVVSRGNTQIVRLASDSEVDALEDLAASTDLSALLPCDVPHPFDCEADPRLCECGNSKMRNQASCRRCKEIDAKRRAEEEGRGVHHPAMVYLRGNGAATVYELMGSTGLGQNALHQFLSRAQRKGWVYRKDVTSGTGAGRGRRRGGRQVVWAACEGFKEGT